MAKNNKILGIFDKRPLIWFHYVLLLGVLYLSYYIGDLIFKEKFLGIWLMLSWFYIWISLGDQIIHKIINVD